MKIMIAALAAGAAIGASALPAIGQSEPSTETLTLTSVQANGGERLIDLPPRGDSVGDRFAFASTLWRDGRPAGRMLGDCAMLDKKLLGMQCTLTAVLSDGSIELQGASLDKPVPGTTSRFAGSVIVGGTGHYRNARGTMRRTGNGKTDTLVFDLR